MKESGSVEEQVADAMGSTVGAHAGPVPGPHPW